MRTSPTGWSRTNDAAATRRDLVNTAVEADADGLDEVARRAGITRAELDGLLDQDGLSEQQANTILAGLANPNSFIEPTKVAAPYNTVAPTAPTGTKTVGQTLTRNAGTWVGDATITYTYRWFRATSQGGAAAAVIAGQTGSTYVLAAGDANKYIACEITATNDVGTDTVLSAFTTIVSA